METPEFTIIMSARFLIPNNRNGSKVRLTFSGAARSITIPYDHAAGSSEKTALNWCKRNGIAILFVADDPNGTEALFVIEPKSIKAIRQIVG